MGTGISAALHLKKEGMTEQDVVDLILPGYFTKEPLTDAELRDAKDSWELILHDRSPHFSECKSANDGQMKHDTCIEMFYFSMFTKLMDIHPESKDDFEPPPPGQGRSFVHYMGVLLNEIDKELYWNETLINMTIHHSRMGVRAMECEKLSYTSHIDTANPQSSSNNRFTIAYCLLLIACLFACVIYRIIADPVLGTIFMHAVKECVGPAYTDACHAGWLKIWSKILNVTVPTAVKFELDAENVLLQDMDSKTFCPEGSARSHDSAHDVTGVRRAAMMFGHSSAEGKESKD